MPVLSRLTWTWFGSLAFIACTVAGAIVLTKGRDGPGRVALAIEDRSETLARPTQNDVAVGETSGGFQPATGVTLAAAPQLRDFTGAQGGDGQGGPVTISRDHADEVFGDVFGDAYVAPKIITPPEDGDVVITIDGRDIDAPKPSIASVQPSWPVGKPIRDVDASLLQKTPLGKIPKIAGSRKARNVYAYKFTRTGTEPRVALIVGGLGLNANLTARAIDELPSEVTLAFAPYSKDVAFWTSKARAAGHEVMIELPMETHRGSPAALGPAGLLTSRSAAENLQRLDWLLSRFDAYVGATNYLGGKFSADRKSIGPILARLDELGLAYVDDTGAARGAGSVAVVNRLIAPTGDGDNRDFLRRELSAAEKIAERDGAALVKTYAYAASIEEAAVWAEGLEKRGLVLAPATAVLRARTVYR